MVTTATGQRQAILPQMIADEVSDAVEWPGKEVDDALLYDASLSLKKPASTGEGKQHRLPVWIPALRDCSAVQQELTHRQMLGLNKEDIELELPDSLSVDAVRILCKYLHRTLSMGNPPFTITLNNATELHDAAMFFGCREAVDACVTFWHRCLDEYNCLEMLLEIGIRREINPIRVRAIHILSTHFSSIVSRSVSQLLQLPASILLEVIRSDLLDAPQEITVFETVLTWANHQKNERYRHLADILQKVRFIYCGESYLRTKALPQLIALASLPECTELAKVVTSIQQNMHYVERQPTTFMDVDLYMLRPRVSRETLFAIGGWSGGQASALVEAYDNRAHRWYALSQDNDVQPRAYHGLVGVGPRLYMIGGFDGTNCFNDVRCYDSGAHRWSERAPMHRERCYVSTAVLDEKVIYALGGYDGTSRTNTAEKYDIQENTWTMIAPMNAIRSDACAATVGSKIFIVGGFTGDGVLPSVEFYDPKTNAWTLVRSMSSPRSGVRCVSHDGRLVVLGGYNGRERLCSVERYDERRDRWERLGDMPTVRSNFGAASFEGRIFAIGGFNGQSTISQVDAYDPITARWTTLQGMTVTRSALGACICETADPEYYSMLTRHSSASAAAFNAQMALDRLALPRAPAPSRAAQ
ncbi:kelch-like protein 10 isoform X1 [Varroa jacobsoni]|uniref:BACK domain-containing protein n=2 Tax=Varroa TaxID=62624 RepID=A0A7M7ME46_VARDE|nr:kelch-like protein 10 isoform X1 [Varroa destructor]XP_022707180.1 kelch-like protein 10 isoform X1 [Varroa jacobsoni]